MSAIICRRATSTTHLLCQMPLHRLAHTWGEPLPKPASELFQYVATVSDFSGKDRTPHRTAHLEMVKKGKANGWIIEAGGYFADDISRTNAKISGSFILMREESTEKALERFASDVYNRNGIWDMSTAKIVPVALAKFD